MLFLFYPVTSLDDLGKICNHYEMAKVNYFLSCQKLAFNHVSEIFHIVQHGCFCH